MYTHTHIHTEIYNSDNAPAYEYLILWDIKSINMYIHMYEKGSVYFVFLFFLRQSVTLEAKRQIS